MELTELPVESVKLWKPTCRLALSDEQMVSATWRADTECMRGIVIVTLFPSALHPGFIHYEVMAVRGGEWITSREPVYPSHVGDFIAHVLKPWGVDAAALSWQKADAKAPDAPKDNQPAKGEFVYFLAAGPFVKIGKATGSPHARIRELQTGCPFPIRLVAHVVGGLREEHALHRQFSALRAHGEWFRHEGALAEYVRGIAGGKE